MNKELQKTKAEEKVEDLVNSVASLPQKEREIVFQKLEIYQGDLPHPDILEGYQRLYPNAAERIINNGIAESEHRRKMEEKYLEKEFAERKWGQVLGFLLALLMVSAGIFLIYTGQTIVGSVLSGVTALGLVGLFTGTQK